MDLICHSVSASVKARTGGRPPQRGGARIDTGTAWPGRFLLKSPAALARVGRSMCREALRMGRWGVASVAAVAAVVSAGALIYSVIWSYHAPMDMSVATVQPPAYQPPSLPVNPPSAAPAEKLESVPQVAPSAPPSVANSP